MTAKMLHEVSILPLGKITMLKTGDTAPQQWVYQRTHKKKGNLGTRGQYGLQIRRRVIPVDPQTMEQLKRRFKFADAVAAWQALDETTKQQWRRAARSTKRSGYAHFLSAYMTYEGEGIVSMPAGQAAETEIAITATGHFQNNPP